MADITPEVHSGNAQSRDRLPNRRCAMRAFAWDPDGTERRAGRLDELLNALRYETFMVRCQLADPRNDSRRALLATRLDVVDARAANLNARLVEAAS